MTTADAALGVNRFRASQLHVVLGGRGPASAQETGDDGVGGCDL